MATYHIWQDTSCLIPHGNLFRISGGHDENGNTGVFYLGRAVSPTGTGNVTVYYNRICAQRMVYGHPYFHTRDRATCCAPQTFTVEQSADDGATWSTVASTTFWPDWSYESTSLNIFRNVRINDHFHPLMVLFHSQTATPPTSVTPYYVKANGQTQNMTAVAAGGGTTSFPLATTGVSTMRAAGFNGQYAWATPRPCAPGAFYYRNALGGWDSFLIEGSISEAVEMRRWTRKVPWIASVPPFETRGEDNYASEMTNRWTIVTGGLTDRESILIAKHLIPSNDVWLHDFRTDTILPVILDDTSQVVKMYKNSGRRVVVYTINCHRAQDFLKM